MDTIIPWHLALAVIFCLILRKALRVPALSASVACILGTAYHLYYQDGYEPLQSFISDLITVVLLLAMGYYLLKCYFSDHGIFGTITQPQKPSSSIVVYEQDNSQAVDSIDHSMLATVDNPPSGSGPVLVFRCPSDSEDDTEDDVELFEHPNTVARVQACSRIFKEMRDEDESLKASNVVLRMKQRRMERQAKTWDSKNARVNIKVSLVTGAFLEMKQIHHQTRAELSAEEQARETEIRLRDATNGTELAKLQSLYKKASAELNSAYKKAGDLETEAGINKGLIQTLRSEVDRAELDKAERLDSERKLEDECSLKRIQELGDLRGKLTLEADAGISKKSEIVRLENERALKVRDEEIEKQRTLQEASNEELERLRQEVQTLKSAAVIEKQKLTEDLESTNKCLEELSDVTEQLETTRNTAESLQSQLISKEAEKADLSRELNELALELNEANGKATSLQRQLSRKEAEETDASRQLKEQAKQLDAAKSTAESLQLRLNEKNDNDEEMEDVTAPHVCDHSECKRQLDDEKQVSQAFREKVLVLEPRNQRLEMPYNEAQAPLKRQLQDVKQARDAAYANVATLKAEKRDLEEKLRKRDGTVEAGIAESARLEHTIQGLKDIAKATRDVQAASHPGGDNLSTTKVGGGGRRKREEDEEQGERLGSEAHVQRVETTGPIAKHIKGPVPKAVVEAPVQAPSRDLLKGKFGHEVGNQIEQWFGIMGEAKRPGIFSTALQTWMKFLMEDFDALQNACQTVALHLNMITVVNLQDHGLMLFAHHLKDLVHYCLKTGIWSPEKIEKMKSVEKYAQMILKYGVEAGAEFKDCKDPNTFYYRR